MAVRKKVIRRRQPSKSPFIDEVVPELVEDKSIPVFRKPLSKLKLNNNSEDEHICAILELSDGTMLTAGFGIKRWTPDYSRCIEVFDHSRAVVGCLLQLDDQTFLSGSRNKGNTLKRWSFKKAEVLPSSSDDTYWQSFNNSGRCLNTFEGHLNSITSMVVLRHHDNAIVSSAYQSIHVWRISHKKSISYYDCLKAPSYVFCLLVLNDGTLASGSDDGCIRLWDVENKQCYRVFKNSLSSIVKHPIEDIIQLDNGNIVTRAVHSDALILWDFISRDSIVLEVKREDSPLELTIMCRQLKAHGSSVLDITKRRNGTFLSCSLSTICGYDATGSEIEFVINSQAVRNTTGRQTILFERSNGLISHGYSDIWLWRVQKNRFHISFLRYLHVIVKC